MDRVRRNCRDRRGFTLVEILVVLGIISLLAGVLLPTLTAARRASANTKCMNNLREIGMAVSQYMADNEQTVPPGVSSNTWDDPGSPRGALLRPPPYQPPDYIPWLPSALPVAYYLDNYLKYDLRVWRCPGVKVVSSEPLRQFRVPQVVQSELVHTKDGTGMWGPDGEWRPGYMYMSTTGWGWFFKYERPTWDKYGMREWAVRSIAGLRVSEIKTVTLQPSSEIVVFFDYSSVQHSKAVDDVYELKQTSSRYSEATSSQIVREKYQSNFLYLDGHADTRRYTWQGGLLNVIHKPLARGSYQSRQAGPYKREFPD